MGPKQLQSSLKAGHRLGEQQASLVLDSFRTKEPGEVLQLDVSLVSLVYTTDYDDK